MRSAHVVREGARHANVNDPEETGKVCTGAKSRASKETKKYCSAFRRRIPPQGIFGDVATDECHNAVVIQLLLQQLWLQSVPRKAMNKRVDAMRECPCVHDFAIAVRIPGGSGDLQQAGCSEPPKRERVGVRTRMELQTLHLDLPLRETMTSLISN
jgi:hypothetical protein